jgi:hypothetical protein
MLPQQHRGWGKLLVSDENTGYPCTYDLCPTCIQKIAALLDLKTGEQLLRERGELIRTGLSAYGVPSPLTMEKSSPVLSKTCETCNEPYVGDSCYFCPVEAIR